MPEFIVGLLVACLLLIAFQDFRERAVNWYLFSVAFVICAFQASLYLDWIEIMINFGINLTLLVVLFTTLLCYLLIRFGRNQLSLWNYLGLGDVLFFIVLAICFSPFNFVIFTVVSLMISLLTSILFLSGRTVPLAGIQALCLGIFSILQYFLDRSPFNDNWIYLWM